MLIIGSHVGFNKQSQLLGSVNEALKYGANTFMFYTGAPQNTMRYEINDELTRDAILKMKEHDININNVIVHAPYIVNLANNDVDKHEFAISFLKQEINRCDKLGVSYMVLHPGSHVNCDIETGLNNIIDGLNKILVTGKCMILLETMAGKGNELGSNFNEIKYIIDGVHDKKRIGVCMDTCHLNDAGYDISDFDSVLDDFSNIVGLNYLKCIHINDSKNILSSHKDRHENIGYGTIGFENLMGVLYNSRVMDIPKILETPYVNDLAPYKEEIEMIRSRKFDDFKGRFYG